MTPPFHHITSSPSARLLILCDHASSVIPDPLECLGLGPEDLASHIAWDIGAAALARRLATDLNASCLLAGVSRLVVDCNRAPHSPGWMPDETCGVVVPGNRDLSETDVRLRRKHWYDPYHQAIEREVQSLDRPTLLAIHSFTPTLHGQSRPWHVGLLWNEDDRLVGPMLKLLRQVGGIEVGDNQPYSGKLLNYTLDRHAQDGALPHLSIEVRQDLIADAAGVERWGRILLNVLTQMGL